MEETDVRFFYRFQINTFEIVKRISELLKPKVNVVVPFFFSDDWESSIVISLPKLNDRFLNGIFSNKIRKSGKTWSKIQVNECTNGRLKSIVGFLPWMLGSSHGGGWQFHQNKKNGRRTETQSGISIFKIVFSYSLRVASSLAADAYTFLMCG